MRPGLANAALIAAPLVLLCATAAGWAAASTPPGEDAGRPAEAPAMEEHPLGDLPADDPRMESYAHGNYILRVVDFLWSAGLLALIAFSGFGATLQTWAGKAARGPNQKVAMYVALVTLAMFAGSLPLAVYGGFVRERRFGFANQTFAAWLGDRGKALLVAVVLQALFFTVLYAAIRRLGRRWWLAGAGLSMVFLVMALAVAPVMIAPLFNTFEPLEDGPLRTDILAMARSQGIPAEEVYEVDASRQSSHSNAYVAGLLGTQRIVLYDTLLQQFTPREIKVVMGHEMGHYVLNHIWRFVAFLSVFVLLGFFLVDRVSRRIVEGRPALGISSLSEPASLPVLLLVLDTFLFLAGPALSTFSRIQEHQADEFGLDATRDPVAGASAFLKFGRLDLGEYHVHPWIEALLCSHPSLGSRVRFAQDYARQHGITEETPAAGTAP
ncbi:MAG: M48 family metallopeptidase [Acidobacteria bacterium]|nr:M48 family metallopeptidase [Acidobacteriota bacterium]